MDLPLFKVQKGKSVHMKIRILENLPFCKGKNTYFYLFLPFSYLLVIFTITATYIYNVVKFLNLQLREVSKIKENDIIKTTITFNPRIYQEAQIIAALYEKGKFSTNIKATLIRAVCKQNPMLSDNSMFLEMNEEDLVSCLGILLYTIDKKGIDISKMVMGYCNIQPQIITTEGVIPSDGNNPNENIEEEDLEDLTEDVENCGIDLC